MVKRVMWAVAATMVVAAGVAFATVPSTTSVVTYSCSGTATQFTVPFRFLESSHLKVTTISVADPSLVTTLALATDYTVSGASAAMGSLKLVASSRCAAGYRLRIRRVLPLVQPTVLPSSGAFTPKTHESVFDRLTMIAQQLNDGALTQATDYSLPVTTSPDEAVVLATSTSTPRALKDRFADVVNVKDFGAKGDGTTDDTAAIQAAIAAVIPTPANPLDGTRVALAELYAPAGRYRITAPLAVYSAQGFRLRGAGKEATVFVVTTAGQASALDLFGTAYSTFSDFSVTTSGAGTIDQAIWLRWVSGGGAQAYRSSTRNAFRNVMVTGQFKAAFAATTGDQTDNTSWDNCTTFGQWTNGEGTWWQFGFEFGSGTTSNNLIHTVVAPEVSGVRYGVAALGTNVSIYGGSFGSNGQDLYVSSAPGYFHAGGFRSEGSQRLLATGGSGTFAANVTVEDVLWQADGLAADKQLIAWRYPGTLNLRNLTVTGALPATAALLSMYVAAGAPYAANLNVDGLTVEANSVSGFLSSVDPATVALHVRGATSLDAGGAQAEHFGALTKGAVLDATYGTTVAISAAKARKWLITPTSGAAFTIANPTGGQSEALLTIAMRNTYGVLGTVTWGSAYKLSPWTSPAYGYERSVTFRYDGTRWTEEARTPGDVPYQPPMFADDAGTAAHVLWNGSALVDTKSNAWSMAGTVVMDPASATTPGGSHGYLDTAYYFDGTGNDSLDFAGDFTVCAAFGPIYTNNDVIFSNGTVNTDGYLLQLAPGPAVRFATYSAGAASTLTSAAQVVVSTINCVCAGRAGATEYLKVNLNATTSQAAAAITAGTSSVATVGKYPPATNMYFRGTLYEVWLSSSAFADALATAQCGAVKARLGLAW